MYLIYKLNLNVRDITGSFRWLYGSYLIQYCEGDGGDAHKTTRLGEIR